MSAEVLRGMCAEVEERLSEVLDGTAPIELLDHIADCDACRDRRYEAEQAAERVAKAGVDFRPAPDFAQQVLARVQTARPGGPEAVPPGPIPKTLSDETESAVSVSRTQPSAEPVQAVRNSAPESDIAKAKSHHGETSARPEKKPEAEAKREVPEEKETKSAEQKGASAGSQRKVVPLHKRTGFLAISVIGTVAAAAAVGGLMLREKKPSAPDEGSAVVSEAPWSGEVSAVLRASADKSGGLEVCSASGACTPADKGAAVEKGSVLKTDARTRAYIKLADGSELALDRATKIALSPKDARKARVEQGTIVANVTSAKDISAARFWTPQGDVEVLGTKLAITAAEDRASVEVARGTVRVRDRSGKDVEVRAGEEATLVKGSETVVASTSSIADVMEWSDRAQDEVDAPTLKGLGELRARKPGQTKERDKAVRLAKHSVKVRIVDVVARTEIDETFANDTDEELEGIFRFPLPPGGQIEKLSLEVDGKLIDGAFVDRDRGAAIWRGVIQNAAPKAPKPREEIIWVPGPWRDPALLEWQRGGRFELRIFPIPKRGSRRVVLTYTQLVDQSAGVRRFSYPLAHDASGTTKIDNFDLDVQVLGHDKTFGIQTRGYDLANAQANDPSAERKTLNANGFTPAGDLTIEYALPDRTKEATAWAYSMSGAPAVEIDTSKAKNADEKAAMEAAQTVLNDQSPYVAIALRPKLPRWQEAKERVFAIVVDSSRSMFGERFARATRLASSIVKEMDRRDSFVLLACDTVCKAMTDSPSGPEDNRRSNRFGNSPLTASPTAPGPAAAGNVERFLGSVEPDGGSDLAASVSAARAAVGSLGGKELRILYLGDGTPTVGPTKASHLETAVRNALPGGDASVVSVALGSDADITSLTALARGGGGVVIPYVPGQKVTTAALSVLGAAYGAVLRDPEITLPPGLSQVTPASLDPIRAGGETFVVARMNSGQEVSGSIKLRGKVAGERFEQEYPVRVVATGNAGNAFVPRLFAAAKIAELERFGGESQKPTIIELSKRFAVASKHTSLLVLESEAMFKAFGLDKSAAVPGFTGEQGALSSSADAEGVPDEESAEASADEKKSAEGFGSGHGRLGGSHKGDTMNPFGGDDNSAPATGAAPMATAAPAAPAAEPMPADMPFTPAQPAKKPAMRRSFDGDLADPWENRSRRMIPMRRIFERKGGFEAVNTIAQSNASKLIAAESALSITPDSRDKTAELYALYATSGRLNDAQELTAKWSGRDALDPDALMARADLAARQGDRERAIRILGGLADVRPGDKAIQIRLATLHDVSGNTAFSCEHKIALATLAMSDAKRVADAVACTRNQGMNDLSNLLRLEADRKVQDAIDKQLSSITTPLSVPLTGDVQLSAEWTGGVDLDVALIDAQGKRISWLGSPLKANVSCRDVTNPATETLAVSNLPAGNYIIEISRANGADANAFVQGNLTLRVVNETRKIPFNLSRERAELGTARVFFTSRLVPVNQGWGGFP